MHTHAITAQAWRIDYQDFLAGTFLPAFLALDSPIAIACFGFFTFLPLRPDLSWPFFMAFISVSTLLPAAGEYFRRADFFADDFFFAAFLVAIVILLRIRWSSDSSQLHDNCLTSAFVISIRRFDAGGNDYTIRRKPGKR